MVVHNSYVYRPNQDAIPDVDDPIWIRLAYVGALIFGVAGVCLFFYALFTWDMTPGGPWPPPKVVPAFILVGIGAVLTVVTKAGQAFTDSSRRR